MIERNILYSCGNEARVYKDAENCLVRMQANISESDAITKFTSLKIASLFFPEHFIKVLDLKLMKKSKEEIERGSDPHYVTSYMVSELAPTDPNHAIYSRHLKKDFKFSNCYCEVCRPHSHLHFSTEYMHQLSDLKTKLNGAGILVPDDDHTDHCLGPNGIIFFEADLPETPKLREYLKILGKNEVTEKINALLSYQQMLISQCSPSESFRITKKVYPDVDLVDYSLNSSSIADNF